MVYQACRFTFDSAKKPGGLGTSRLETRHTKEEHLLGSLRPDPMVNELLEVRIHTRIKMVRLE